jgi:hypothetical protein
VWLVGGTKIKNPRIFWHNRQGVDWPPQHLPADSRKLPLAGENSFPESLPPLSGIKGRLILHVLIKGRFRNWHTSAVGFGRGSTGIRIGGFH